jgi:hypothetical protein
LSFIKIRYQPMGRQVCLTMPFQIKKKLLTFSKVTFSIIK